MKKTSFSMVVLLGLGLAVPALAQTPEGKGPNKPPTAGAPAKAAEKGGPDKAPGKPQSVTGKPQATPNGAPGAGPGATLGGRPLPPGHPGATRPGFDPHGAHGPMGHGLSPEDMAKRTETMKERMAEHAKKLGE